MHYWSRCQCEALVIVTPRLIKVCYSMSILSSVSRPSVGTTANTVEGEAGFCWTSSGIKASLSTWPASIAALACSCLSKRSAISRACFWVSLTPIAPSLSTGHPAAVNREPLLLVQLKKPPRILYTQVAFPSTVRSFSHCRLSVGRVMLPTRRA